MVEIYNEQVRDLLSNDIAQKRYPFYIIALPFFVVSCEQVRVSCVYVVNITKAMMVLLDINKHLGFGALLSLMDLLYRMRAYTPLHQHQMC
jgi:hypothetical protein